MLAVRPWDYLHLDLRRGGGRRSDRQLENKRAVWGGCRAKNRSQDGYTPPTYSSAAKKPYF